MVQCIGIIICIKRGFYLDKKDEVKWAEKEAIEKLNRKDTKTSLKDGENDAENDEEDFKTKRSDSESKRKS